MNGQADQDALVRKLGEAFAREGEELFLVGGSVRDELLARVSEEPNLDFATSARPDKTARILEDLRMAHPYRIGEKFGTIGMRLGEQVIEITTYRVAESYGPGSRKPEVEFGTSLNEDMTRRDFTINALARKPSTGELIDPLGGVRDLEARLVRAVGVAEERFAEDPLRLLRAVRIASKLGFDIETETWSAIQKCASGLEYISRERIRDEYSRILLAPSVARGLTLLRDSGLMLHSVPELLVLDSMKDHGPFHALSLWDHTLCTAELVEPRLELRWAALLHDIAKPATRTQEPSGRPRFFHHEEVGAHMAREILGSLRYPNQLIDEVTLLIETHMHVHSYSSEWTDGAVRRLMLRLGRLVSEALNLSAADAAAHHKPGESPENQRVKALEARIGLLERGQEGELQSPLSGEDLMKHYQRPPGPWIRMVKDALREEVIEGSLAPYDRERAFELADKALETIG